MKLLKRILRGIVVAFFASTILSVVALRFIPVYVTPLMVIRAVEYAKTDGRIGWHHHWVS